MALLSKLKPQALKTNNAPPFLAKGEIHPTLYVSCYASIIEHRHGVRLPQSSYHFSDLRVKFYDEEFKNSLYRRDTEYVYKNTHHYLENLILQCQGEKLVELYNNLIEVDRWCFLNIGAQRYGFFGGSDQRHESETVAIRDLNHYMQILPSVTFLDESDLLAFKLRFG